MNKSILNRFDSLVFHTRTFVLPAVCCGIALMVPTKDAAANFRVSKGAPHAWLYRSIYKKLPHVWKMKQTIFVREVSDSQMEKLIVTAEGKNSVSEISVIDGYFQDAGFEPYTPPRIVVRKSLQGENAALVFTHELGHYIWNVKLNERQRAVYKRIWNRNKQQDTCLTTYSEEADDEAFGDAFAYYIIKPATLKEQDTASYRFIKNLVNKR